MAIEDRVQAVVDPIVEDLQLELVDLVYAGGRLKITIDHPDGLSSVQLTKATRMISYELDLADPITSGYTLEVTSPGVERALRVPEHYFRSIGEQVNLKLQPNDAGLRRLSGELTAADDDGVTLVADGETHTFSYHQISKAKTVFDWGPGPKPGKAKKQSSGNSDAATGKAEQ
jgi:ribosome maturation factor RimP